jgi:hypothetical protein
MPTTVPVTLPDRPGYPRPLAAAAAEIGVRRSVYVGAALAHFIGLPPAQQRELVARYLVGCCEQTARSARGVVEGASTDSQRRTNASPSEFDAV